MVFLYISCTWEFLTPKKTPQDEGDDPIVAAMKGDGRSIAFEDYCRWSLGFSCSGVGGRCSGKIFLEIKKPEKFC